MSNSKLCDFLKSLNATDYIIDHNNESEFNVNNIVKYKKKDSTLLGVVVLKGYNYINVRYSNGFMTSYNFDGSKLYSPETDKVIFHVRKIPIVSYY